MTRLKIDRCYENLIVFYQKSKISMLEWDILDWLGTIKRHRVDLDQAIISVTS